VATQEIEQPEIGIIVKTILLTTALIVLPGLQWSFFGWSQIFLPLLSFFLLGRFGGHTGKRVLLCATTLSLVVYLMLGGIELFLFSFALLFSGVILFRSAERHESPALSGFKTAGSLAGSWFLVVVILSAGSEVSVYDQLLKTLDHSIVEAVEYYRQSASISSENLVMLETSLYRMQLLVPMIMPAVLGSTVLMITWLTMVIGNTIRLKTFDDFAWDSYRNWQLPEKLVWGGIVMAVLTLAPTGLRTVGINCLILLGVIYCFQGLSILVFFMNKWNVPLLFRSFFYVMIIFQSLGTLVLLFVGLADIWLDFRKKKPVTTTKNA